MCKPRHLSNTSENWRRTSRSCITVVRWDKWKNPQMCRYDGHIYFHWYKILGLLYKKSSIVFCTKDKFKFGAKLISDNFYVSVPDWFLFLYFKYWYFRSLKHFWDCDLILSMSLNFIKAWRNDKWYTIKEFWSGVSL
jgi:hypothetical protein